MYCLLVQEKCLKPFIILYCGSGLVIFTKSHLLICALILWGGRDWNLFTLRVNFLRYLPNSFQFLGFCKPKWNAVDFIRTGNCIFNSFSSLLSLWYSHSPSCLLFPPCPVHVSLSVRVSLLRYAGLWGERPNRKWRLHVILHVSFRRYVPYFFQKD